MQSKFSYLLLRDHKLSLVFLFDFISVVIFLLSLPKKAGEKFEIRHSSLKLGTLVAIKLG